jgi:hypothetical protein
MRGIRARASHLARANKAPPIRSWRASNFPAESHDTRAQQLTAAVPRMCVRRVAQTHKHDGRAEDVCVCGPAACEKGGISRCSPVYARAHREDLHHSVRLSAGHLSAEGEAVGIARGARHVDCIEARLEQRRVRAIVREDEVPNARCADVAFGVHTDAMREVRPIDGLWVMWLTHERGNLSPRSQNARLKWRSLMGWVLRAATHAP